MILTKINLNIFNTGSYVLSEDKLKYSGKRFFHATQPLLSPKKGDELLQRLSSSYNKIPPNMAGAGLNSINQNHNNPSKLPRVENEKTLRNTTSNNSNNSNSTSQSNLPKDFKNPKFKSITDQVEDIHPGFYTPSTLKKNTGFIGGRFTENMKTNNPQNEEILQHEKTHAIIVKKNPDNNTNEGFALLTSCKKTKKDLILIKISETKVDGTFEPLMKKTKEHIHSDDLGYKYKFDKKPDEAFNDSYGNLIPNEKKGGQMITPLKNVRLFDADTLRRGFNEDEKITEYINKKPIIDDVNHIYNASKNKPRVSRVLEESLLNENGTKIEAEKDVVVGNNKDAV